MISPFVVSKIPRNDHSVNRIHDNIFWRRACRVPRSLHKSCRDVFRSTPKSICRNTLWNRCLHYSSNRTVGKCSWIAGTFSPLLKYDWSRIDNCIDSVTGTDQQPDSRPITSTVVRTLPVVIDIDGDDDVLTLDQFPVV